MSTDRSERRGHLESDYYGTGSRQGNGWTSKSSRPRHGQPWPHPRRVWTTHRITQGRQIMALPSLWPPAVASGGQHCRSPRAGPDPSHCCAEDGDRRLQKRRPPPTRGDTPIPGSCTTSPPVGPMRSHATAAWMDEHGHNNPLAVLDTPGQVHAPALPGEGAYNRDYRIGSTLKGLVDDWPGSTLLAVHHTRSRIRGLDGFHVRHQRSKTVRQTSPSRWLDLATRTLGCFGSPAGM